MKHDPEKILDLCRETVYTCDLHQASRMLIEEGGWEGTCRAKLIPFMEVAEQALPEFAEEIIRLREEICDWTKDRGCRRFPRQNMQIRPISARWDRDGQVVLSIEVTLSQESISKPEAEAIVLNVSENISEQFSKAEAVIQSARDACEELEGHGLYAITTLRQALAQYDGGVI